MPFPLDDPNKKSSPQPVSEAPATTDAGASDDELINYAGDKLGVPSYIRKALFSQESGGKQFRGSSGNLQEGQSGVVKSDKGALGIAQVMPDTAKQMGFSEEDLKDPVKNAAIGLKYLKDNYDRFKPKAQNEAHAWGMALAAYHAGPGRVQESLDKNGDGIPDVSDGHIRTPRYVMDVLERAAKYKQEEGGARSEQAPGEPVADDSNTLKIGAERSNENVSLSSLVHSLPAQSVQGMEARLQNQQPAVDSNDQDLERAYQTFRQKYGMPDSDSARNEFHRYVVGLQDYTNAQHGEKNSEEVNEHAADAQARAGIVFDSLKHYDADGRAQDFLNSLNTPEAKYLRDALVDPSVKLSDEEFKILPADIRQERTANIKKAQVETPYLFLEKNNSANKRTGSILDKKIAEGAQGTRLRENTAFENRQDIPLTIKTARSDEPPTPEDVEKNLFEKLGPHWQALNEKFKADYRKEYGQDAGPGGLLQLSGGGDQNASYDQKEGAYKVNFKLSDAAKQAMNAYAQGGLPAYKQALEELQSEKQKSETPTNAEPTLGQEAVGHAALAAKTMGEASAQTVKNVLDIARDFSGKKTSDVWKGVSEDLGKRLAESHASLPEEAQKYTETVTGQIAQGLLTTPEFLARYGIAGSSPVGFLLTGLVSRYHETKDEKLKGLLGDVVALATGPAGRMAEGAVSSRVGQVLLGRAFGAAGMSGMALNAKDGREAVAMLALGAILHHSPEKAKEGFLGPVIETDRTGSGAFEHVALKSEGGSTRWVPVDAKDEVVAKAKKENQLVKVSPEVADATVEAVRVNDSNPNFESKSGRAIPTEKETKSETVQRSADSLNRAVSAEASRREQPEAVVRITDETPVLDAVRKAEDQGKPLKASEIDSEAKRKEAAEYINNGELRVDEYGYLRSKSEAAKPDYKPQEKPSPKAKEKPVSNILGLHEEIPDRREVNAPVEKEQRSGEDRRKDFVKRRKVAEMTGEERAKALLTSEETGLKNKRAYEEDTEEGSPKKQKYQVALDAEGLKWINDNIHHHAGDELIRAVGRAAHEAGIADDTYHRSGDEFVIQAKTKAEAAEKYQKFQKALARAEVKVDMPDGSVRRFRGINLNHGIGEDYKSADVNLNERKKVAIEKGERAARGTRPKGFTEISEGGSPVVETPKAEPAKQGPLAIGERVSHQGIEGKVIGLSEKYAKIKLDNGAVISKIKHADLRAAKEGKNDNQNGARVSSQEPERKSAQQAKPERSAGKEEAQAGGVFQGKKQEVGRTADNAKPDDNGANAGLLKPAQVKVGKEVHEVADQGDGWVRLKDGRVVFGDKAQPVMEGVPKGSRKYAHDVHGAVTLTRRPENYTKGKTVEITDSEGNTHTVPRSELEKYSGPHSKTAHEAIAHLSVDGAAEALKARYGIDNASEIADHVREDLHKQFGIDSLTDATPGMWKRWAKSVGVLEHMPPSVHEARIAASIAPTENRVEINPKDAQWHSTAEPHYEVDEDRLYVNDRLARVIESKTGQHRFKGLAVDRRIVPSLENAIRESGAVDAEATADALKRALSELPEGTQALRILKVTEKTNPEVLKRTADHELVHESQYRLNAKAGQLFSPNAMSRLESSAEWGNFERELTKTRKTNAYAKLPTEKKALEVAAHWLTDDVGGIFGTRAPSEAQKKALDDAMKSYIRALSETHGDKKVDEVINEAIAAFEGKYQNPAAHQANREANQSVSSFGREANAKAVEGARQGLQGRGRAGTRPGNAGGEDQSRVSDSVSAGDEAAGTRDKRVEGLASLISPGNKDSKPEERQKIEAAIKKGLTRQQRRDQSELKLQNFDKNEWLKQAKRWAPKGIISAEDAESIFQALEAGNLAKTPAARNEAYKDLIEAIDRIARGSLTKQIFRTYTNMVRSGLLTGFGSLAKHVVSGAGFQATNEISKIPAAFLDIVHAATTGKERTVTGPELKGVGYGAFKAVKEGIPEALKIIKTGKESTDNIFSELGREPQNSLPVLRSFDKLASYVFRTRGAVDAVLRTYAINRAMYEMSRLVSKKTGKDFEQLLSHPTPEMEDLALRAGLEATFQNDNILNTKYQSLISKAHPIVQAVANAHVLPFAKVTSNVFRALLDYSGIRPGWELLNKNHTDAWEKRVSEFADVLGKDNAHTRAIVTALGKGLTFYGLALAGAYLMKKGHIQVTGFYSDTDDTENRIVEAKGAKPASIKIGGKWVDISHVSPVATALIAGASAMQDHTENQAAKYGDILYHILEEQPHFRAASDTLEMVKGKKSADSSFSLSNLNPLSGAMRDVAALGDNVQRDTKGDSFLEEQKNQFKNMIPGLRNTLPAKKTFLGDEKPQQFPYSPVRYSTANDSALSSEMERLHWAPSKPKAERGDKSIEGKREAIETVGPEVKKALTEAVNTGYYRDADDETKKEQLKAVSRFAQKEAKEQHLRPEEVSNNIEAISAREAAKMRLKSSPEFQSLNEEQQKAALTELSRNFTEAMADKNEKNSLASASRILQRIASRQERLISSAIRDAKRKK